MDDSERKHHLSKLAEDLKKYSDDQPRDDRGRWQGEGGAPASGWKSFRAGAVIVPGSDKPERFQVFRSRAGYQIADYKEQRVVSHNPEPSSFNPNPSPQTSWPNPRMAGAIADELNGKPAPPLPKPPKWD